MKNILIFVLSVFVFITSGFAQENGSDFKAYGVKINVPSIEKAIEFYSGTLGFKVHKMSFSLREAHLFSGDNRKIILRETSEKMIPNDGEFTCSSMSLRVNNLDESFKKLSAKGVKFIETSKRTEGIGFSMHVYDTFGNLLSLDEVTVGDRKPFDEPKLYNFGIYIPDIQKGMDFHIAKIGFIERTKQYLPEDMPLYHNDKSFGFMLHLNREKWGLRKEINGKNAVNLIFTTKDLAKTQNYLKKLGIKTSKPAQSIEGRFISFKDSFGIRFDVIETTETK